MKLNEPECQRTFIYASVASLRSPLDRRASSNFVIIIILNDNGVLDSSFSDPYNKQAKFNKINDFFFFF